MKALAIVVVLGAAAGTAHAAPFRPFVDAIGVTPSGVIVTTTTRTGQDDRPVPERHELMMFAPDGAELLAVRVEAFADHGVAIDRGQWRALDRWLASLRLRRVVARPLAELRCATRPGPDDTACPASTDALVRTATGIARWNPDGALPAWAWGTPAVAEIGTTCVLLWPNNRGDLDRIEAVTAPCPLP